MSKFLFLVVLSGCALFATNADALKVSVSPSVTFRSSNQTCYPCVRQVVTAPPVMEVRRYIDCYGRECFYEVPVYPCRRVVNSYYYPQSYYSQGTDFALQFRIN